MFKKFFLVCALMLAGCASHSTVAVQPPVAVKAPETQVLKTANYSVTLPSSFTDVKKPEENQLDFVYKSPDSMLIVTLTTDQTADNLDTYAMNFSEAMGALGADLLQAKEGIMGGMKTVLFVMGMNKRFLVLHFLAQDPRPVASGTGQKPTKNVYYLSCALNPLMLKWAVPACMEISKSFTLTNPIVPEVHIGVTLPAVPQADVHVRP